MSCNGLLIEAVKIFYPNHYHFVKNNNEKDYTVIDINNWVNIIPVTKDKKIILIKQYRHGIREIVTEIPGGVIEKEDSSPEVAARRELLEETGYTSDRFINIGTVIPNPAIQSNKCYFYLAENITKISSQNLDPQEDIEIYHIDILPQIKTVLRK